MAQRYNVRPVIGTSIATGETVRLVGGAQIIAAGFEIACVFRCCAGGRKSHGGFTWCYDGERIRKPHVYRGTHTAKPRRVIGHQIGTDRRIELLGKDAMRRAGFEPSCISRVACGRQANHKGWVFHYENE